MVKKFQIRDADGDALAAELDESLIESVIRVWACGAQVKFTRGGAADLIASCDELRKAAEELGRRGLR